MKFVVPIAGAIFQTCASYNSSLLYLWFTYTSVIQIIKTFKMNILPWLQLWLDWEKICDCSAE